jgi:probable F420-dependent oxidoreductase
VAVGLPGLVTTTTLKVGVQLPEVEDRDVRWPEIRDMARVAEDVGLDSIWVGDHLLYRDEGEPATGPWEAWSMLAALAAVTSRVELGPLVAAAAFHNPAMLAKKAATLDEISGGRLILGLGAGWNEVEFRAFGYPYDHRVDRFEEAFTIIRTLLRKGRVDFEGRYHRAVDCELVPRGPRPDGPPIVLGTTGPRMLDLMARYADGWNAWFTAFGNRPEGIPELRQRVDAACRAVGRDPATLERSVAVFVQLDEKPVERRNADWTKGLQPLRGADPDELAGLLRAFAAQGIAHVQIVLDPITAAGIERLGPAVSVLRA